MTRRSDILHRRLQGLESEFHFLLPPVPKQCAAGRWGLEIVPLMQKGVRRHGATSPETFSAWSICRREKLPVKAFSGPSLWLFREREKERLPDPPQGRLVH